MSKSQIILLTGKRQIGKSTLCLRLIELAQEEGLSVAGLVTKRTGPHDLEVLELTTNRVYALTLPFAASGGFAFANFRMDPEAMGRSALALEESFPTDVFVLDEIGPLELVYHKGWSRILTLLAGSDYKAAFIVVRPELLLEAILQLPNPTYTVVHVLSDNRDYLPTQLLKTAQRLCAPDTEV
jgi:nucleoside-triphosphatase THEP1